MMNSPKHEKKSYSEISAKEMWILKQKETGFDAEYSNFKGDKHLTEVEAINVALESIENQGAKNWYKYFYLINKITENCIELYPKIILFFY